MEDVEEKIERVTPIFNTITAVSDKLTNIFTSVFDSIQNFVLKLFLRNRDKESESDLDE